MLCALTVRRLEPGTFARFREAFMAGENLDDPPPGYVRFNMIRNTENPDEVICCGFFDGTADELRRTAAEQGYAEQLEAIAPFVQSVGADGLYEAVEDWAPSRETPKSGSSSERGPLVGPERSQP